MYREIIAEMSSWKDNPSRKPFLLIGTRGVGKTWVAKDFGIGFFDATIVIDFEQQENVALFDESIDKNKIFKKLNLPEEKGDKTLLIFENIHFIDIYRMFEFFSKYMSQYFIICTTFYNEKLLFGDNDSSEYCEVSHLYPLSFGEFLIGNKEFSLYSKIENHRNIPLNNKEILVIQEYLNTFYYTGGMPMVVKTWIKDKNIEAVKENKKTIIEGYEKDFNTITSKPLKNKVFEVWNSIGMQLAKENKKFQFGIVKLTARAREYNDAVEWLYNRGYIDKLYRIKDAKSPIESQKDEKSFEIFMIDVGLLAYQYEMQYQECMAGPHALLAKNSALTEQFVYQELLYNKNIRHFYYWISEATARIGFVFEDSDQVIPIDINIDDNKKSQSLKVFKEKYKSKMAVRITYDKFSMEEEILNIPLYSIWNL